LAGQFNAIGGGAVAAAIVIAQEEFVPVPPESVTLTVKLPDPGVVGVPVMAPVAVLRVRPVVRVPPKAAEKL
jgi:hypothetical protein